MLYIYICRRVRQKLPVYECVSLPPCSTTVKSDVSTSVVGKMWSHVVQSRLSGEDLAKFQEAEKTFNAKYGAQVKTEHAFNGLGIIAKVSQTPSFPLPFHSRLPLLTVNLRGCLIRVFVSSEPYFADLIEWRRFAW